MNETISNGKAPTVRARRKLLFLKAYTEKGTIGAASMDAGVHRVTHWKWLQDDPDYAEAFAFAHEHVRDTMERELIRRGRDGWEEPVFHRGKLVGHVRKYDTACLIFWLKGEFPEKYRERVSIISEDAIDAEIARLSTQLGRAQVGEAAPLALPPAPSTDG